MPTASHRPGSYGSDGLGVFFGGVRQAAEGDLVAEGTELADVVVDLTSGLALAFVVVRPEVAVPHAGVGQQDVEDAQLGVG